MTNIFHKDFVLDDNHALTARTYADVAARDADTAFQVAANVDKVVRVDSPVSLFLLVSVSPAVWIELSNTEADSFIDHPDTPASYTGQAGKVAQVNAGATALEFGQALRTTDNPTFNDLVLTGDLTVRGITTTIDTATLLVKDKNIELGVVATPTDVTADGGGITLKGTTDKTIVWDNITNAWTFNQDIDAVVNTIKTTGSMVTGSMIASIQALAGNLLLAGNTLSSINANGDINLTPNGTGKVVIDDLISVAGGVFKFTNDAVRAGLDAVEYVEMGHGGGNGFINAVGDGGLDIRFEGVTLATFTDFGHLHLQTNVDQKHTLKIITSNNLNDTGLAWENSGGAFTGTIFRTDIGSNRADLVFAAGQNVDIDLLTNSFKIHGSAADPGRLEVLGSFQISSGVPGLNKVLTSDASGLTTWETPLAAFLELTDTPSSFTGQAGKVVQVDTAEVGLEFGQALRTTDSPTFNDLVLTGDLTVQGLTTTLDTITLLVEDKNIELGNVAVPTDITADGGGFTLLAGVDGDKTIQWRRTTNAWTFNQSIDLLGNNYITTGSIVGGTLAGTSLAIDNLFLDGNTLSSLDTNGDVIISPNGTGETTINSVLKVLGTISPITTNGDLILDAAIVGTGVVKVTDQLIIEGSTSQLQLTDTDNDKTYILKSNLGDFSIVEIGGNNVFKIRTGAAVNSLDINSTEVTIGTKLIVDNLSLDGNTISSTDLNGNINFSPNGTGSLVVSTTAIIGSTSLNPDGALHVHIASAGSVTANSVADGIVVEDSTNTGISILTPDASVGRVVFGSPSDPFGAQMTWSFSGSDFVVGTSKIGASFRLTGDLETTNLTLSGASGSELANFAKDVIVNGQIKIAGGSPGENKVLTSDAVGLSTWEVLTGTTVQETFASTNVRFFGELALPATQGWTDVATGSATIDLQTQFVFEETKQVVRHNDDFTNGSTTSSISLTSQNWTDINAFGAVYSGTSRLDTTDGAGGFFSGLQANTAENPLATGNRRYGILFADDVGNLKVTEPDAGTTVTFDGTGGNPLILFDEWFTWECVVPAGLGAAQFFINEILTTFAPTFRTNAGGLGTKIIVSSGSTSGSNRITYHDNFGVTIFEDAATKTLAPATMGANIAQVNIPEGRRDYTIILPDGNPRELGSVFRVVANNLFGKITLENQNPAAPQILYNGLRTLVIDVFVKEIIGGINTVDQGNVYIGFKDEDVVRAGSIFAQLSSSVDQIPVDTNPTVITYNTQDEINGIGHSTSLNPGELEILPGFGGVYFVSPQPQVGKDTGGVKVDLDMFWEIDRGSGFVDEPNSNVKITIKDADITDVIVSAFAIPLAAGDKIRMLQKVSDSTVGMGLKNTDPVVGPPTVPRTPSIILAVYRVGGI